MAVAVTKKIKAIAGAPVAANTNEVETGAVFVVAQPADEEVDALKIEIDALGALEGDLTKAKKLIADHTKRVSVVRDKLVASGELTKVGDTYYAVVKEAGNITRTVKNMPKAVKFLGAETFLKVAKITLADIDAYLTDAEKEEVLEIGESKTRSIKIMKRV
jgi:hypothetical protein